MLDDALLPIVYYDKHCAFVSCDQLCRKKLISKNIIYKSEITIPINI